LWHHDLISITIISAYSKIHWEEIRESAMKRFRYKKSSPQNLEREANEKWVKSLENENSESKRDPVEAIDGILTDLDIDSVELQHKARELWASKVTRDLPG
jgi:16S rRNA C1402 N4-methylase RsmH